MTFKVSMETKNLFSSINNLLTESEENYYMASICFDESRNLIGC